MLVRSMTAAAISTLQSPACWLLINVSAIKGQLPSSDTTLPFMDPNRRATDRTTPTIRSSPEQGRRCR